MTEGLVVLFIVIYLVVSIQLLAAGITHQSSSPRITFCVLVVLADHSSCNCYLLFIQGTCHK